jgi:hypothetical protein
MERMMRHWKQAWHVFSCIVMAPFSAVHKQGCSMTRRIDHIISHFLQWYQKGYISHSIFSKCFETSAHGSPCNGVMISSCSPEKAFHPIFRVSGMVVCWRGQGASHFYFSAFSWRPSFVDVYQRDDKVPAD